MLGTHTDLVRIYDLVDQATERIRTPWWPCKRGCSSCCSGWIMISEAEGRMIQRANKESVRSKARAQLQAVAQRFGHIPYNKVPWQKLEGLKCAALLNGECEIYNARPLICRCFGFSLLDNALSCNLVDQAVANYGRFVVGLDWREWNERFKKELSGEYRPIVAWLAE